MAKIIFSDGSEIRGRVGGKVYSRNASGAYIRKYTKPTNANTALQNIARNQFASISQAWRNLTDAQRASYEAMRTFYKRTDSVGNDVVPTASQLFARLNGTLLQNSLIDTTSLLLFCPSPVSLDAPNAFDPANDVSNGELFTDITFANGLKVVPADTVVAIAGTPAISAGIEAPQPSAFQHLGYQVTGDDTATGNAESMYANVFGHMAAGTTVWLEITLISTATGQMTSSIKQKVLITP